MSLFDDVKQAHMDEPCPKCKAKSGEFCVTASGNPIRGKPHADRIHNGNILFQERMESGFYE